MAVHGCGCRRPGCSECGVDVRMDYVTKDSGARESFESGAVRDTRADKGRYDLISWLALHRIAGVYERGALKYEDRNWEAGMPIGRCIDSALRHIGQYMLSELDEDHLGQAAWNLIAALHFDEGILRGFYPEELDDRPQYRGFPVDEEIEAYPPEVVTAALQEFAGVRYTYREPKCSYCGADREDHESHSFAGIPHSPGVKATLDKIRAENEIGDPMPEVQYSSDEQGRNPRVPMHDRNHSTSEGAWHVHKPDLDGPAFHSTPALSDGEHRHKGE
jgi:hypothetical protein